MPFWWITFFCIINSITTLRYYNDIIKLSTPVFVSKTPTKLTFKVGLPKLRKLLKFNYSWVTFHTLYTHVYNASYNALHINEMGALWKRNPYLLKYSSALLWAYAYWLLYSNEVYVFHGRSHGNEWGYYVITF